MKTFENLSIRPLLQQRIKSLLREYKQNASCGYETTIIKALKLSDAHGRIKRAACNDSTKPDADITIDNEIYYVEIKMNSRAQMGGGTIAYSLKKKEFSPTGQNLELSSMISDLLNDLDDSSLHKGLSTLLQHLSRSSNKKLTSFPSSGFSAEAWNDAKDFGLLQAINRTFNGHMNTIVDHYANKNTHYIQIGGAGFFRLGDHNPAKLPIPKLSGKVKLEVRVAKSGNIGSVSKAGIRVQARLITTNKSPYTLDDPNSVSSLLNAI